MIIANYKYCPKEASYPIPGGKTPSCVGHEAPGGSLPHRQVQCITYEYRNDQKFRDQHENVLYVVSYAIQ